MLPAAMNPLIYIILRKSFRDGIVRLWRRLDRISWKRWCTQEMRGSYCDLGQKSKRKVLSWFKWSTAWTTYSMISCENRMIPDKEIHHRLANLTEVSPGRGLNTAILATCNAVGQALPPFWIFPGERFLERFIKDAQPGSTGITTTNGWLYRDVFLKYLKTHSQK